MSNLATGLSWYWSRKTVSMSGANDYSIIGQTTDSVGEADTYLPNGIYLASFNDATSGEGVCSAMWLSVQDSQISYTANAGLVASVASGFPTPYNSNSSMVLVTGRTLIVCNGNPDGIPITLNVTVYRLV